MPSDAAASATRPASRREHARDFSRGATSPPGVIVGATMRAHCCDVMRAHVQATAEPAALVAADRAVLYDMVFDEYSLAGTGSQCGDVLAYCPWCGAATPPSKRDLWFAELTRRGLDPDDPRLDERYRSDEWWRTPPPVDTPGG